MKTIFRALLLAGIFTLPSFAIASVSLNRDRSIDVQDYGISIRFDRSERVLFGDTVITFKALRDNFQELELDSVGIRYSNVTLGDTDVSLPFRTTPTKIFVQLPRQMRKGEELRVRLRYSATRPKMGVYFVERGNFRFSREHRERTPLKSGHRDSLRKRDIGFPPMISPTIKLQPRLVFGPLETKPRYRMEDTSEQFRILTVQ